VHSPSCRDELRADLAEFEEKVDNITVSNPRVAQEYRWEGGGEGGGIAGNGAAKPPT
jgi:hypothetical protein